MLLAAPQPGRSSSLSIPGIFFGTEESLWLGLKFAHVQGVGGYVRSVVQFSLYFLAVEGFSVITFFCVYKPLSLIPQYLYFFLRARV